MRTLTTALLLFLTLAATALAQQPETKPAPKPEDTEVWTPEPKVVTPGATPTAAPSDAIILFDGKNLDEWVSVSDKSPAKWIVGDGIVTVNKATGNIETKRSFKNYQLHLEWRVPEKITPTGPGPGPTGRFFSPPPPPAAGDDG